MVDDVEILNKEQTVDIVADACNTIGYEILTHLGLRYQRDYI
jgi:alanine racemase